MRLSWFLAVVCAAVSLSAAERKFDFSSIPEGKLPPGFRTTVMGVGGPGEWKVLLDEVPPMMETLSSKAPVVTRRPVLAQVSQDPAEERFPMLVFQDEVFTDFTLTTRVKMVGGKTEQMAGVVFRLLDETNYYVLRASALGNTFRFYKVVNGVRGDIIGPEIPVPTNVWHEIQVECKGNAIRCRLNGQDVIPSLTDNSFTRGRIGFWTKSDSVSYFTDTRITYTPLEKPAAGLIRAVLAEYPRVLGLDIYMPNAAGDGVDLVASKENLANGRKGGEVEMDVIRKGNHYVARGKGPVSVTSPLRDRNGDPIAAVRITMESFKGQTEQNALVRAMPITKMMQARVAAREDLVE
jgi:hypothetical protein